MLREGKYWRLSTPQRRLLESVVKDHCIVDVGAGDGSLCLLCIRMGAKIGMAIDSKYHVHNPRYKKRVDEGVFVCALFDELELLPDRVAIVSWPEPYEHKVRQILRMIHRCETVVYIGVNDQGTACATPAFFAALKRRLGEPVSAPGIQQMLVYGRVNDANRVSEPSVQGQPTPV